MTKSEDSILYYLEVKKGIDFYDDVQYDGDNEIYNDSYIEQFKVKIERISGIDSSPLAPGSKRAFKDVWREAVVPQWENIAEANRNKFEAEIRTNVPALREIAELAETREERDDALNRLRSINVKSYSNLRSVEAKRAKKAFRQMFG